MKKTDTDSLLGNKGAHIYNGNIQQCEKCNKFYKTTKTLQNHKCNFCSMCGKLFSSYEELRSHKCTKLGQTQLSHTTETQDTQDLSTLTRRLSCKYCHKLYKTPKTLQSHQCTYCFTCEKVFSTISNFKNHKCSLDKESECNYSEDKLNAMKNNLSKSKDKSDSQPLTELLCSSCHKTYRSQKTLKNHKCSYCDSCGTIFSTYQRFMTHKCTQRLNKTFLISNKHKLKDSSAQTCYNGISKHFMKSEMTQLQDISRQDTVQNVAKITSTEVDSVKQTGTLVSDDVICAALAMIRERTGSPYHGHITPAEMTLYLQNPTEAKPIVPPDKLSINIHNIGRHWVTSVHEPQSRHILVYDSLHCIEHYYQILPQLKLLYGVDNLSRVDFLPVTQQGTDPACGVFAIAFAFSFYLGQNPSELKYSHHSMRQHLSLCLDSNQVLPFPVDQPHAIASNKQNLINPELKNDPKFELHTTAKATIRKRRQRCEQYKREKENAARRVSRYRETNRKRMSEIRTNQHKKVEENAARRNKEYRAIKQMKMVQTRSDQHRREKENAARRNKEYRAIKQMKMVQTRSDQHRREKENAARRNKEYRDIKQKKMVQIRSDQRRREKENAARRNKEYRDIKQKKMVQIRSDQHRREKENAARRNKEYRDIKQKKMVQIRSDQHHREKENAARRNKVYRDIKQKKMDQIRSDQHHREKENAARRNKEYRDINQKKMVQIRSEQHYKERENASRRNKKYRAVKQMQMRQNRRNVSFKDKENSSRRTRDYREKKRKRMKQKRSDSNVRSGENLRSRTKQRRLKNRLYKKLKRINQMIKSLEKASRERMKRKTTVDQLVNEFHKAVEDGPQYICTCCNQMWYRESVQLVNPNLKASSHLKEMVYTGKISAAGREWVCHTCCNTIRMNKLPKCATANLMNFSVKPEELNLTQMEERLVSPRIPFMCLHQLPRGGQLSLTGNVVNVPSDVNQTMLKLPRRPNESDCIPIKLKRKLSYKHHVDFRTIRPKKVIEAVNWLVTNSKLYQQEGISLDTEWHEEDINEEDVTEEDDTEKKETENGKEDDWEETQETNLPPGVLDTLLQPQDLTDEARRIYSFAPAEGNTPVSVFMDKNSEELSFPTLFCGNARPDNSQRTVNVTYGDICKSELRCSDRRMAGHIPNIFFKYKKLQTKHILDKANICIRKTKRNQDLTAAYLKTSGNVEKLCRLNEGFRIFKDLRGSPPYWEQTKKDLFAMIRRLGIPTWFMSFSSAETRWYHLLQILHKCVHGTRITEEQVAELTWFQKSELIKSDPVTCARHFDHQVKKFLNTVLQGHYVDPVGPIEDFFYKVEFQMRGSPHIHMLAWVKNTPVLDGSIKGKKELISFVDKYVTCSKDPDIIDLVSRQEHSHSRTCQKKNKKECRFNFPIPPMPETNLLEPLGQEISEEDRNEHKTNWENIKKTLIEMKMGKKMDFSDFLKDLHLTLETYTMAVRSSLSTTRLFLKRQVDEIRINNYNKILLRCWRANMDIQLVLDPYSCAMYIITYISKSQKGMSNLLYEAAKEAKEGSTDIRKQVKSIGHKFLNHVEVSAQEAVYFILQLPLKNSSREVVFVNTSPESERVIMLKSQKLIERLPDESTDVETKGIIQRYAERPRQLEDLCLADFSSWFKVVYRKTSTFIEDEETEVSQIMSTKIGKEYKCNNGTILRKRNQPVVIRYVRYQHKMDPENYFREILMLFHPWRDEKTIIGNSETYQDQFETLVGSTEIHQKMVEYKHNWYELDLAVQELQKRNEDSMECEWDRIAPGAQQIEREDEEEGVQESDIFPVFAPTDNAISSHSDLHPLFESDDTIPSEIIPNYLSDEEYLALVQSLNTEQRRFFIHVLHILKTSSQPVYYFLTGGAGVGKTVVVKAIFQAMTRYYNRSPDSNPDYPKILLGAPTGVAAYLIKGNTLHSLFRIPASQGYEYKPLTSDTLNTLHCQFRDVKLLIIDEVSMVGHRMLSFINLRLQQINCTTKIFGGLSIIAVGDLYQLKPVFDGWIFENLTEDYGPLAMNLWTDHFQVYHLIQIMRQKDSADFAKLLNRLRQGNHTKSDIGTLKTRIIPSNVMLPNYPLHLPHIFLTNSRVDDYNNLMYERAPACHRIKVRAIDIVLGDASSEVKKKVLASIPSKLSKTMGLPTIYKSAIGLRNELSCNIDVSDGLVNGAGCVVKAAGNITSDKNLSFIWVEFEDMSIGKKCRENNRELYTPGIDKNWTPIFKIKRQFPVGRYKSVLVLREQFPLRFAPAKTAHRTQGDTMNEIVVDFSGRCFPHSHYVALSRVRTLDGLHIRVLNEKKIHTSELVEKEIHRLNQDMPLQPFTCNYTESKQPCFRLLYQNVRSLRKHITDMRPDECVSCSDILLFTETKLKHSDQTDNFALQNFHTYRFDHPVTRNAQQPYGIAVYSKDQIPESSIHHTVHKTPSGTIEMVTLTPKTKLATNEEVKVVACYVSPKINWAELKKFLEKNKGSFQSQPQTTTIVCGDFNIDLLAMPKHPITNTIGLQQHIHEPTTDTNSLLDHMYISESSFQTSAGVIESHFSDHKPIYAILTDTSVTN